MALTAYLKKHFSYRQEYDMNVSGRKALSSRVPTKLGANPWHFQVFNAAKQGLVVIDLQGNVEFQNSERDHTN